MIVFHTNKLKKEEKYKNIALNYYKKKDYNNFEKYMQYASKYSKSACEYLARFYISNKEFSKAKDFINKIIEYRKKIYKRDNIKYVLENDTYTWQIVEYYNFKYKYPYIRKELLKMFDIDIKTFNNIIKEIKDDEKYKKNSCYSNDAVAYLKNKLN